MLYRFVKGTARTQQTFRPFDQMSVKRAGRVANPSLRVAA